MAKEKLYKPEDFVKPTGSSKKDKTKWIIVGIAAFIAVTALIFVVKSYNKDDNSVHIEENNSITGVTTDMNTNPTADEENAVVTVENDLDIEPAATPKVNRIESQQVKTDPGQGNLQSNPTVSSDLEAEALKVIRGDFGNNPERKNKLGIKYNAIQKRVNEMKREGVF